MRLKGIQQPLPITLDGEPIFDDWFGLYAEKWADMIAPDAVAHPAKFARALIRRIYDHASEEGWLKPGDSVLDPFGGVALGAFDAMRHGLNWIGCELEPRFCSLAQANVALWNERFKGKLPLWGTARILQGDSRRLASVIEEAGCVVSSPPYSGYDDHGGRRTAAERDRRRLERIAPERVGRFDTCFKGSEEYGSNPSNLGNLKEGDHAQCLVSSPPYAESLHGEDKQDYESHKIEAAKMSGRTAHRATWGVNKGSTGNLSGKGYSSNPDNLGNLKEGDHAQCLIASPPYASGEKGHPSLGSVNKDDWGKDGRDIAGRRGLDGEYGASNGQLANLPTGDISAVISSPPLVESLASDDPDKRGGLFRDERRRNDKTLTATYGQTDGQLGGMRTGAVISSPPFETSLASGEPEKKGGVLAQMERGVNNTSGGAFGKSLSQVYSTDKSNLGNQSHDTFWSASRTILEQCHQVLSPGAHAIFVLKDFVRNKKIVPFCEQWAHLCEAVGFRLTHIHRSWLIERKPSQHRLDGGEDDLSIERKSFFRRLAEKKGSPRIDFEVVLCFERLEQ